MLISECYRNSLDLLIRCLPAINQVPNFALRGGTAINLFYRNLSRVSVDIDLTYLPITDRKTALNSIHCGMIDIAEKIRQAIPQSHIQLPDGTIKLQVSLLNSQIKIETNTIARGSLLKPVECDICSKAQEQFEKFVRVRRLAVADLYGSKICAALDRQHPRDLFDVMLLQREGAIPDIIRQAFVVYLAGHNRPMAELLAPNIKPIEYLFEQHFSGMTEQPVTLNDLESARVQLFDWVIHSLSEKERKFLLSIKQGDPDWTLLPFKGLDKLPAIQWKLHNIRLMDADAHNFALNRLRNLLEV